MSVHPSFDRGLINLCHEYMTLKKWSQPQQDSTNKYLAFLARRSKGQIPTGARFIRDFVLQHPAYKQDSIVSKEISYDLLAMIDKLESNEPESAAVRAKLLGALIN